MSDSITYPAYQLPLEPIQWPQDELIPPPGYGQMPPVDLVNATNIGREFYAYPFSFSDLGQGEQQQFNINTTKDGDFWLTDLYVLAFDHNTNFTATQRLSRLAILDTLTSYQLFNPYLYIAQMTVQPEGQLPKCGIGQSVIQPTCYQRGTVIQITASTPAQGGGRVGQDIYGILSGWKEYADASQ